MKFYSHQIITIYPSTTNLALVYDEIRRPCDPSPCGANAECKERDGAGSCTCLPEYFGDPYSGCRPECSVNNDCPRDKACLNNKCRDPCPGVCGFNAECYVVNHSPACSCLSGYVGDPLQGCRPEIKSKIESDKITLSLSICINIQNNNRFKGIQLTRVDRPHVALIASALSHMKQPCVHPALMVSLERRRIVVQNVSPAQTVVKPGHVSILNALIHALVHAASMRAVKS